MGGSSDSQPPPAFAILLVYTGLGFLIAFLFGKDDPSNQDFVQELVPVIIVSCGFLVSYELLDVMAVGAAKLKSKCHDIRSSKDEINQVQDEEVYLAQRVQTNQVEQMTPFLIGSYSCALLVDGKVAGVLAMFWAILRRACSFQGRTCQVHSAVLLHCKCDVDGFCHTIGAGNCWEVNEKCGP